MVNFGILAQVQLGQLIRIAYQFFQLWILSQVLFLDRIVFAIQLFQVGERLNAF